MPSNAAKEWAGTFKELEQTRDKLKRQIRRCLKNHKKFDKQDPDTEERKRRSQQTLDTLSNAFDKVDQFLKTATPRQVNAPAEPAFPPSMAVR
jgi:ribosome recycling factor